MLVLKVTQIPTSVARNPSYWYRKNENSNYGKATVSTKWKLSSAAVHFCLQNHFSAEMAV